MVFYLHSKQSSLLPCISQTSLKSSLHSHFLLILINLFQFCFYFSIEIIFSLKKIYWTTFACSQNGIIVTRFMFKIKWNKADKITWNSFQDTRHETTKDCLKMANNWGFPWASFQTPAQKGKVRYNLTDFLN